MSSEEQVCPCGLTGENCDQVVEPLRSVDLALNETCFEEGFQRCRVISSQAVCKCKCGWSGDFCDDRNEPIVMNYIFGGVVLPLMFLILFFSMKSSCKRRRKSSKRPRRSSLQMGIYPEEIENYSFEMMSTSNVSWVTPKILLIYRILAVFTIVPVLIFTVATEEHQYETFSIWNFTLLGAYFFFSAIVSALYILHYSKPRNPISVESSEDSLGTANDDEGRAKEMAANMEHLAKALNLSQQQRHEMLFGHSKGVAFLERELGFLLHVVFVIELPSAMSIAFVIWIAFLPQALENGDQDQILNVSSYFLHAVNVGLILGELYLNKLYLEIRYGGYFYLWATVYMIFNLSLMFGNEQLGKDHCPYYYPLDLSSRMYPGYIALLFLAAFGMFMVCYFLSEAKYNHFHKEHRRRANRHSRMSLTAI